MCRGPVAQSERTRDWLQQSWPEEWNQNLVYAIDATPGAAVASAQNRTSLTKHFAQETRLVVGVPGDGDARAEASLEWCVGIFQLQVPGCFKAENRGVSLAGESRGLARRHECVRMDQCAGAVDELDLRAVLFDR